MFNCPLFCFVALAQARARPSASLTHPTVSIEGATGPTATLTDPTVSIEATAGPSATLTHPSVSTEIDDSTLLAEATMFEEAHVASKRVCLPAGWIHTLPEVDQRWISKALFRWAAPGRPELIYNRVDKLWWYPPPVPLKTSSAPSLENYFGHPLLLWMPRKLWQLKLTCPHPDCQKDLLTSAGLHQKIRVVIALNSMYFVASEYLACRRCKRKVISWSHDIVSQLDIGHRVQFPCILTSKLACDFQVVCLMRQRGLGNSSSQIQRKLQERHAEVWLQKTVQYLTDCKGIASAVTSSLILPVTFEPLPPMPSVPKHRWLMQVYAQDVLQRLDEIKAAITSQYGRILKMDSTKKVARKLAGPSYGTAAWATNVGNEHGQVIMSVLTASEGFGLGPMIEGLIRRYRVAGVAPPEVLYVDRDCCGNTLLRRMFEEWEQMTIRLDIWHFMRRFSVGCTTDCHPLYATFMSRLSHCIFMWDQDDLTALKMAKRAELEADWRPSSEADVLRRISRSELALHCRRTTRGTKETLTMIESLIQAFEGDAGRDTLGVPLINSARMTEVIKSQRKHVACIQDPQGVQLYMQTGTLMKGGHRLPTYRCARGSTSLESFHLHLNRFIPGTLASDTFFQAYLLDGLARWNEDRAVAATTDEQQPHSYSHLLRHAANILSEEVMGMKISPYVGPRKYTGELIGVEYLYQQTGKVLQDYRLAIEESETTEVAIEVEETYDELEEFQDITVPTFDTERIPSAASQASVSAASSSTPPATRPKSSLYVSPVRSPVTSSTSSLSVVPPVPVTSSVSSSLHTQPALSPGAHSCDPAQRPDCNRVVEGIFIRLCALYQNAVRDNGERVTRFTMIARVYRHIRECILTNDRVMRETTIQLPQMNAKTISDWFSKRDKSQDVGVTKQGINFPDAPMAGPEKLPAALQKGPTLFPGSLAEPHLFVLPRNTAGEAKLKRRSQPPAISQAPPSHQRLPIIAPAIPVSLPFILPSLQLPTVVDTPSSVPGTSQVVFFNVPLPSAMPPSAQTHPVKLYLTPLSSTGRENR
ncbi:uncharacterized protein [Misgurnus anguillicaudatus]|uniref:uncharacterized protein n=1 Tax=Misgurnus anguillicaudatus TaxID=75329 RepID=UPI003CCFC49B